MTPSTKHFSLLIALVLATTSCADRHDEAPHTSCDAFVLEAGEVGDACTFAGRCTTAWSDFYMGRCGEAGFVCMDGVVERYDNMYDCERPPVLDDSGTPPDGGAPEDAGPLATVPPACGSPCGGDITGRWVYEQSCFRSFVSDPSPFACVDVQLSETPSHTGFAEFLADGTYSYEFGRSGFYSIHVPATCLPTPGGDCASLDPACTGESSTGCDCRLETPTNTLSSGTFSTTDSVLTLTRGASSSDVSYCVSGDRLWFETTDLGLVELRRE